MRAPLQVLVIPFLVDAGRPFYCILKRSDAYYWHFIAGGAEDAETPLQAAIREANEEIGAQPDARVFPLKFQTFVPAQVISQKHRQYWPEDTYIIPEYNFAIQLRENKIRLSQEHTEYCWVAYEEAISLLNWQSNAVALYELNERIKNGDLA